MDKIEELLKDPKTDLQKQALTDTSYKNIDHSVSDDDTNFELATYGDAVLKLALCKIYREYKENGLRFSENLSDWKVYIIPVLYVITSFISMKITSNMNGMNKKEENKVEQKTDDGKEEIAMEEMNKTMARMAPIMSVSISMIAPLGLALYWLMNSLLMIFERLILNKLLKDEEE